MSLSNETLIALYDRACESTPEKPAIIYLGEKFSYRRLKGLIDRFAAGLYEIGVRQNDKAMLYIPNCPQFLIGYFGIQRIGAVAVPISPIYTPREVKYLVNDSGAETVLCQDTNYRYIMEIMPESCLKNVIITNLVDLLPLYKKMFGTLFDRVPNGVADKADNIFSFKKFLHQFPPVPPKIDINAREHLCYILYTGGTTGFPKGCISTDRGMVSFIDDINEVTKGFISEGKGGVYHGKSSLSSNGSGHHPRHGLQQK